MFEIRSKKLAKRLRPRRSIPGSAKALSPKVVLSRLRKLPARYRKVSGVFEVGCRTEKEPELRPIREAAHRLLCKPTVEAIAAAELEVLSAAERMLVRVAHDVSLAHAIWVARGLGDAVEAVIRSERFGLDSDGNWTRSIFVITGHTRHLRPNFDALRHAVCSAPETDYEEALSRARQIRETTPLSERTQLGYVFPDEPWANDDLRDVPPGKEQSLSLLLASATDLEVVRAFLSASSGRYWFSDNALDLAASLAAEEAVDLLGSWLPVLLEKPGYGPVMKTPPRDVVAALSCIRTQGTAEILAPYLGHGILGAQVLAFFQENSEFIPVAERLCTAKRALEAVQSLRAGQDAAEDTTAAADETAIPAVLRDRPWRPRKGRREPPIVVSGVCIPPGAKESLEPTDRRFVPVQGDKGLRTWNEGRYTPSRIEGFFDRHGCAAIPGFALSNWMLWFDYDEGPAFLRAALRIRSPRMAPEFAKMALRRKKQRRIAERWLLADPRMSALGLIPNAVGPLGSARVEAENGLRVLVRSGHAQVVRDVARDYGAQASEVMEKLVSADPLSIGKKPPKTPSYLLPRQLPPVLIGETRLPEDAVDSLLEMLRTAPLDPPYQGFAAVAQVCDPGSIQAFVAALIDQWVSNGAMGRHDWMLNAALAFPSDENTRKIGLLLRAWGSKKKAWAERAANVLAELGTDLALLDLAHVAETSRFAAIRAHIGGMLTQVAERRGLTLEELGDRTVPDLGLDEKGWVQLSYGDRNFTVGVDECLSLIVRDGAGDRISTMPPKRKTDDAALVKASKDRFKAFRKDLESISDRQRRRLERAMVSRRSWSREDFQHQLVSHPVVAAMSRGLVWMAGNLAFRVAEDHSFADVADESIELPVGAQVRIAHPLDLGDAARAWSECFSDYELMQPFPQLIRETFAITEAEKTAQTLERHVGLQKPGKRMLGFFESRGWRRSEAGYITAWLRDFGAFEVQLPISPGIEISYLADDGDQTLKAAKLLRAGSPASFGELDPISFSELVRDLEGLRPQA